MKLSVEYRRQTRKVLQTHPVLVYQGLPPVWVDIGLSWGIPKLFRPFWRFTEYPTLFVSDIQALSETSMRQESSSSLDFDRHRKSVR
jgi:hypothetical protein